MTFMEVYTKLFHSDITVASSLIRILISFICGVILGLERQKKNNFIGIRTIIVITVSSTLLMLLSIYAGTRLPGSTGDPTRIAAQVVSGIGFLGAGTIVLQGLNVKGLTSSAVIWSSAAIGLGIGAGFIIPTVATVILLVSAIILVEKVEEKFFTTGRSKKLELQFANNRIDIDKLTKILGENGLIVSNVDITRDFTKKHFLLVFSVRVPSSIDIFDVIEKIKTIGRLEEFSLID